MRTRMGGVVGEIDSLPGCSQIGVSHSVYVPLENRGQGLGKKANKMRVVYSKETLGYNLLLCTCDLSNKPQVRILQENGWKLLTTFRSEKTQHTVGLWSV